MSLLFAHGRKQTLRWIESSARPTPAQRQNGGCVVCAVQYRLKPMESLGAYLDDLEQRYALAAAQGAKLIAFPELFGLSPLVCGALTRGLFREKSATVSETVAAAAAAADNSPCEPRSLHRKETPNAPLARLVRLLLPLVSGAVEVAETALAAFSKKYGMLTASGSEPRVYGGKLYNEQTLYGLDGRVIGRQRKINPMESELGMGVCYAENIEAFDTELGKLAIPVCMDASYFENFRILWEKGVGLVALGTFNLEEYAYHLALRGIVPRCSEYPLIAVKSAMTGYAMGAKATGCAEICAPCGMAENGVLAASETPYGDALVFASLDRDAPFVMDEYRENFDAPSLRRLLEGLY